MTLSIKDIHHNGTQHKGSILDTQPKGHSAYQQSVLSAIKLSVVMLIVAYHFFVKLNVIMQSAMASLSWNSGILAKCQVDKTAKHQLKAYFNERSLLKAY